MKGEEEEATVVVVVEEEEVTEEEEEEEEESHLEDDLACIGVSLLFDIEKHFWVFNWCQTHHKKHVTNT